MLKKLLIVAVLMVGMALPVAGRAQGGATPGGPQPLAELVETRFDFGEVFEQAHYTHVFAIRNRGKADLVVEDVKPG
ncbi:MAG TPA: DUF1573 domain-containing protein [Candidatus Krumholzibacteria bacterium]|nr:DUF1573 domain-containing protein [Candidatus Krumholzibacteria bacterium]